MYAFQRAAIANVASCCLIATFASLLPGRPAQASLPVPRAIALRSEAPNKFFASLFRPRHLPAPDFRVERSGDTPFSSKYYKITNITAVVDGSGGSVNAVNNDGRMVYNDYNDAFGEYISPYPYLVNNGLGYSWFDFPADAQSYCPDYANLYAFGLNENGDAVGMWGCEGVQGYIAWSVSSADWGIEYFDSNGDGSYANAVNDRDVAVGCYGSCGTYNAGTAAIFEPSTDGLTIELRGLKGRTCSSAAAAINDAGEIIGNACNEAVRFSLFGYAEPLPVGSNSAAYGLNKQGDVVGVSGTSAFLYHLGKAIKLPKPPGDAAYEAAAFSINASGEIVGSLYGVSGSSDKAFVYVNGHAYDLQTLIPPNSGWTIADAYGVNDHGEIVGDGYYNGTLCGISLKPPV